MNSDTVIHDQSGGVEIVIPAKIVNKWPHKHGVRSVSVIAWSVRVGGQWPVMEGEGTEKVCQEQIKQDHLLTIGHDPEVLCQ